MDTLHDFRAWRIIDAAVPFHMHEGIVDCLTNECANRNAVGRCQLLQQVPLITSDT